MDVAVMMTDAPACPDCGSIMLVRPDPDWKGRKVYQCRQCGFDPQRHPKPEPKLLRCDFCDRDQKQVRRLIAGTRGHICEECVQLCADMIGAETEEPK